MSNKLFESIDITSKILEIFENHCSYDCMGKNGPENPGDLLVKYGKDCNYSIRDKGYEVDTPEDGLIKIEWETQSTPISNVVPMIKEALKMTDLTGFKVKLHVYDRDGDDNMNRTWSI